MRKASVFRPVYITLACLILIGSGCMMNDRPQIPSQAIQVIKLKGRDFPDPNEIRGILICHAYFGFNPCNDTHEVIPDRTGLWLVLGNQAELQKLMHRELDPQMLVEDIVAVARISHMYATALRKPQGHTLIGGSARIFFITKAAAYVRDFIVDDENNTILEAWMESKELYQEFQKIGYLKKTSTDPNTK